MSNHYPICLGKCTGILLLLWILLKGSESLIVSMNQNITAGIGFSTVQLKCFMTKENDENIGRISLKARNKTYDDFFTIATFYPTSSTQTAYLTSHGQYLDGRVKLDNPTAFLNAAVLSFVKLRCIDETYYRCDVPYDADSIGQTEISSPTKLTIIGTPSKPDNISANSTLHDVLEGESVLFTCKGYVGKPPAKFIYKKYRHNDKYPINYLDVVTTLTSEEDSEKCTFYGMSNLTIQLDYLDNAATIVCVDQSLELLENMTVTIGPITVYYKVRGISVTKSPDMDFYQAGSIDKVNLTCKADGNPIPMYKWHQEQNPNVILSTENMLIINDLAVNKSGHYICKAYHIINGSMYTETKQINITIVEVHSVPNENTQRFEVKTVVTVVGFVVLAIGGIIAAAVACYKIKCTHREPEIVCTDSVRMSPEYSDVKDVKINQRSHNTSNEKADSNHYAEVERTSNGLKLQQTNEITRVEVL